jgi:cation transport ATPase
MISPAKNARFILKICLIFSISYNSIGLSFAISGQLTPFVAAGTISLSTIIIVFLKYRFGGRIEKLELKKRADLNTF